MSTDTTDASLLSDPILLAAERRRREKQQAAGAPEVPPPRSPRIRGPHVATPGGDGGREAEESCGGSPRKVRQRQHAVPEVDTEPAAEDAGYPLVTEGVYQVALKRCVLQQLWNRWCWICWWQVVEGEALGTELPMFLARPPKEKESRARRAWMISTTYTQATGRRPPKNIARLSPGTYLAGKVFTVKVVTVERDQFGNVVPEGARYSKVKCLLGPITGAGSKA